MCDYFAGQNAATSGIAMGNVEVSDMPDMDALLDQLEREEGIELPNERKNEQNQFSQQKSQLPTIHATIEGHTTETSNTAEAGTMVEQNPEECEAFASDLEQPVESEQTEAEEEPLLIDLTSSSPVPKIVIANEEAALSPARNSNEPFQPSKTKMQIEAKGANEEEVDIFDQIDQMEALIRAEEEADIAENEETAASTSPVKQFVAEMVDRMIGQVLAETMASGAGEMLENGMNSLDDFYMQIPEEAAHLSSNTEVVSTEETNEQPNQQCSQTAHQMEEMPSHNKDRKEEEEPIAAQNSVHSKQSIEEEDQQNALISQTNRNSGEQALITKAAFVEEEETPMENANSAENGLKTGGEEVEERIDSQNDAKMAEQKGEGVTEMQQNPVEKAECDKDKRENTNNDEGGLVEPDGPNTPITTFNGDDEAMIEQLEAELLAEEQEAASSSSGAKQEEQMTAAKVAQPPATEQTSFTPQTQPIKRPLAVVHDLSVALQEFKLTESELRLGKKKPYWIPDEDCPNCMLCSNKFSVVNRRHHCRACGRVLCRVCCSQRRQLAYMEVRDGKQRVCGPCNRTLDRIDEYEQKIAKTAASTDQLTETQQSESTSSALQNGHNEATIPHQEHGNDTPRNLLLERKTKSLLKSPRPSLTGIEVEQNGNGNEENESQKEDSQKGRQRPSTIDTALLEPSANELPTITLGDAVDQPGINNRTGTGLLEPGQQQRLQSTSSNTSAGKRSVTFRDGVNPGQETPSPIGQSGPSASATSSAATGTSPMISPYQWLISSSARAANAASGQTGAESGSSASNGKKLPRKVSRRTKERRIQEEQTSLLQLDHWRICELVEGAQQQRLGGELQPRALDQMVAKLLPEEGDSSRVCVALRRNFHVRVEWRRKFCINPEQSEQPVELLSFSTQGMAAIGADELMLLLQLDRNKFSVPEEIEADFFCVLEQFEQIFLTCLNPFEGTMDHRMGIRKCTNRMARLYHPLAKKRRTLMGHPAAAIYFHRPQTKNFSNLQCPSGPFLLGLLVREEELPWAKCVPSRLLLRGLLVREEELPWAKCVPSRLLLRLGQLTGQYPAPLVNLFRDRPAFTKDAVQFSVLKVLNDFRGWTYQMTQLFGTAITIKDELTEILLPSLALEEIRTLVESNRNMIGWSIPEFSTAEQQMEVDSHLVCEQLEDGHFSTRIFAHNQAEKRKVTAASFVIFDGALKGGEQFMVSIVEDGLVVRLHSDLMEELVKALLAGESFTATNSQGHLNVQFQQLQAPSVPKENAQQEQQAEILPGALVSPIDGIPLDHQFQYGLQLGRQLHAFNFFQYSSEWALRLASVINMMPGKWPSALQPRFFDVCEQLAQQVANTVEPFLRELIAAQQFSIALRIHVDEEAVSYDTEQWAALPDQHFVWTVTLDEQIIPFLYSLCAWVPNGLHVELHMPLLSIRPLPAMTVPASPQPNEDENGKN